MNLKQLITETLTSIFNSDINYVSKQFEYEGKDFTVGYSKQRAELFIWTNGGATSIRALDNVKTIDEAIEITETAITDFLDGFIYCNDCGAKIKQSEVAGQYFAGKFCKACWDREWRAKEARETYN